MLCTYCVVQMCAGKVLSTVDWCCSCFLPKYMVTTVQPSHNYSVSLCLGLTMCEHHMFVQWYFPQVAGLLQNVGWLLDTESVDEQSSVSSCVPNCSPISISVSSQSVTQAAVLCRGRGHVTWVQRWSATCRHAVWLCKHAAWLLLMSLHPNGCCWCCLHSQPVGCMKLCKQCSVVGLWWHEHTR